MLLSGCSSTSDKNLQGANIYVNDGEKKTSEGIGEYYFIRARNSQTMFKFGDYIETNSNATWTVSTDVSGKDVIPNKTVELDIGDNLYYVYVSNKNEFETYPFLIHRNDMFTVRFDTDGGTTCEDQIVEESYCLEESKIPTTSRKGHVFKGWDYDFSKPIENNLTVKAVWEFTPYKVTFDANGGSVSPTFINAEYGNLYSCSDGTLPTPERKGYSFKGWSCNGETFMSETHLYETEVTFVAVWEIIQYTIRYELNGGTNSNNNPATYNVEQEIEFISPELKNYIFSGWYCDNKLITKIEKGTTGNLLLEATWFGVGPKTDQNENKVYYGLYPQTVLLDNQAISALNTLSPSGPNNWYYYKGCYYEKVTATTYGGYDQPFDDVTIQNGRDYWFKVEPIAWRVLKSENNAYYLLSELVLDQYHYYSKMTNQDGSAYTRTINGKTIYPNNYQYSDVRTWLNDSFYKKALFEDDLVKTENVNNGASTTNSATNQYACDNTNDKVYLPSYQDLCNETYGFDSNTGESEKRTCKPTHYATAKGVNVNANKGKVFYWTRSPDSRTSYWCYYVTAAGALYNNRVDWDFFGVRPAITIKM